MSDCMTFPDTLDEFLEQYQFKDEKEVYTNGSMLIPVFRVKQWAEHIPAVDAVEVVHSWWEDCSNGWSCGNCHYDMRSEYPYCPHCGARMDGRREDGEA